MQTMCCCQRTLAIFGETHVLVICLGARVGAKATRELFTIVRDSRDADACALMRRVKLATSSGELLFPSSLARHGRRLEQVQIRHGAECGWTPRPARAGFCGVTSKWRQPWASDTPT